MIEPVADVAPATDLTKNDLAKEMTRDLEAPMLSEPSSAAEVVQAHPSGCFICRCHDGCLVHACKQMLSGEGLTDMRPICETTKPSLVPRWESPMGAGCGAVSPNQKPATELLTPSGIKGSVENPFGN